jgi:hypothetical protein
MHAMWFMLSWVVIVLLPLPTCGEGFGRSESDGCERSEPPAAALTRRERPATAAFPAFLVVYGDIGTNTLYRLKQAVDMSGAVMSQTVTGVVSVVLWSLILIIALRADSSHVA